MDIDAFMKAREAADRQDWNAAAGVLEGLDDPQALDQRGWYLSRAKRYDEAREIFQRLVELKPKDHRPMYMLASQYYEQQKYAEAVPLLDAAYALKPSHLKTQWRRAYALHKIGREIDACIAAGRLLREWHGLGEASQREAKSVAAKASYLLARHQLPNDPQGAVALAAQAASLDPTDSYAHYTHAKALRRAGSTAEALGPAGHARRLKPGDPNIELEYAAALLAAERRDDAVAVLRDTQRRCAGWVAYKGGRLAIAADEPSLALGFLEAACRDRRVKREQAVRDTLAAVRDLAPADAQSSGDPRGRRRRIRRVESSATQVRATGTIDKLNLEHGFGFLCDDDGVRRHFRLRGAVGLAVGKRVKFEAFDTEKGPAARSVCLD